MRPDLLALTDDDLVTLSNRGTVKRAAQEVEAQTFTVEFDEDASGDITARWSDGVECVLPAGKPPGQGRCTCSAPPPCRHLVRTVLAYRQRQDGALPGEVPPAATPLPPALAARARRLFDDGQLFECVRGARPSVRCHSLGVTTRFLVAGDPGYAVCDCGQDAPCEHAAMALLALERLPEGAMAGLVDSRATPWPVPVDALAQATEALAQCLRVGWASVPTPLLDRLGRAEDDCRRAGLPWPAELLAEMTQLQRDYATRDARFDPVTLARTVGEWQARVDAIRAQTGAVPMLFVRGASTDRSVDIASVRLVGLGSAARVNRGGVRLLSFLADEDTGQVVTVARTFADTDSAAPRPFHELARGAGVARGLTLAALGESRLLLRGGKRSARGELTIGRAPLSANPQAFAWEKLRAPVLAEGFAEIVARLSTRPPAALGPRHRGESIFVAPVTEIVAADFDPARQAVVAVLRDPAGAEAVLEHPYHARGAAGVERLLDALGSGGIRFVAGRFTLAGGTLTLAPIGLVVEADGVRSLLQPAVAPPSETPRARLAPESPIGLASPVPVRFLTQTLPEFLGALSLTGLEAAGGREATQAQQLLRDARAAGFHRLLAPLERLGDALETRSLDPAPLLTLAALVALAEDACA